MFFNIDMEKLLTIVISSKNNPLYLLNLIKQIVSLNSYKDNVIDLYVINDNSDDDYSEVKNFINNQKHITYIVNHSSKGKVQNIIDCVPNINSQYLIFLDDKDELLPAFDSQIKKIKDNDQLYVGYENNYKGKKLGDSLKENDTLFDHYYKKALIGEYIYFYPRRIYSRFCLPPQLKNLTINEELVVNQLIFFEPYKIISEESLIMKDYRRGHLTKNLFANKINNWQVTQ